MGSPRRGGRRSITSIAKASLAHVVAKVLKQEPYARTSFCTAALKEALAHYGTPEIFNTDQGSHFTSAEFTDVLRAHKIRISMDGRGRCQDNLFVERLWWTVRRCPTRS